MKDFLDFWVKHNDYSSSGVVSGQIRAVGQLAELQLKGSLQTSKGAIEGLNYDGIHLIAEGAYPVLHISDSTLAETDGLSFIFSGNVDLSDHEHFKKQLKALDLKPIVKKEGAGQEWTIKSVSSDGGKTEFKYLFKKADDKTLKEQSDLLGVQGTMKF